MTNQEQYEFIWEKAKKYDRLVGALDEIKGYVDYIKNTGMGKKKSLEFIEKYIDRLKAERSDKE